MVKRKSVSKSYGRGNGVDTPMVVLLIVLVLLGILMVYNSSVALALRDFNDKYYYVREQLRWGVLGFIVMFVAANIHYSVYKKYSLTFLVISIISLVAVFLPGLGVYALGAKRWVSIGPVVLQPAELTKLLSILYFSALFSRKTVALSTFLAVVALIVGLVMLEPDMGTSMVILGTSMAMYFTSDVKIWKFLIFIPIVVSAIVVLAVISPYRMARLMTFMNTQKDPLGSSYQIRQATIAIGSGGLFGVGLGKSRQKYEYLPEANTDSIFAILAEEVGFIGSLIFMAVIGMTVWRGYWIARRAPDDFSRFITTGIISWLAVQILFNLSSMVSLMPLTGIPLPFISYGGSSLVITLAAMGIVLNISKYTKEKI